MEDPCLMKNSQWSFTSFDYDQINMESTAFVDSTHNNIYAHAPMLDLYNKPQLRLCSWNPNLHHTSHSHVTNQPTLVTSHVQFAKKMVTTTPQHHILAERKRREKISQRFIALSALVPGLKKIDKASVLGDAIKYLKNLQEKVKTLEEQTKQKKESVVFVNGSDGPEVEARYSGKDILIRIHCEKKPGVVQQTLAIIHKLHLSLINITIITFATYALDITIVAQMDQEFAMTAKDLVKNLREALV